MTLSSALLRQGLHDELSQAFVVEADPVILLMQDASVLGVPKPIVNLR